MDRIEKLINILKLTPHYQPELVKEACNRMLARSIQKDGQTKNRASELLRPLLEILIQYCDTEDSAQRSLFNDYLNTVMLNFQHSEYVIIFDVFLNQVTNNGSARTVVAALQRIPHLIQNVEPIDLGCEPQRLLKALIEVCRRSEDEPVLKALDTLLVKIVPYLDYHIKKSKDMQMLSNSFIELLLKNLHHESMQTKRLAASSLATLSSSSEALRQCILTKLSRQLDSLSNDENCAILSGFSLCVKLVPDLTYQHRVEIVGAILKQLENQSIQLSLLSTSLDLLRDVMKYPVDASLIERAARVIIDRFLVQKTESDITIKPDVKVILRVNALSCLANMISQNPSILDQNEYLLIMLNDNETAIKNQIICIIGSYIDAAWKFPYCVDNKTSCENIHRLWILMRSIMIEESSHVETLKSCVTAMRYCIQTLIESDHCLHILEHSDLNNLINLYMNTNFKPLKVELLSLFASLNFKTLQYLERIHWSKMRSHLACSSVETLQDRIVKYIIIESLTDQHQIVRQAATKALLNIIPNLFIINQNSPEFIQRSPDTIVALAQDLADEHLEFLRQAQSFIWSNKKDPDTDDCLQINSIKTMSSSMIQSDDQNNGESYSTKQDLSKEYHHGNICTNLAYIVRSLNDELNKKFDDGKTAISSIVQTMHELCLAYPISQYPSSWDCRNSEYCGCFTTLKLLLTYLENLSEPDIIVEDLETYKNFLLLTCQLLYGVCHQCILVSYEDQQKIPLHKRQAATRDGDWSELTIKSGSIATCLEKYFTHLTKLLCLMSSILDEQPYAFSNNSKQNQPLQPTDPHQSPIQTDEYLGSHSTLISNNQLYSRAFRKLESSYKSSKKNLNQSNERFYQILETCLENLSSILEFISMKSSLKRVKDLLSYLKITIRTCSVPSLKCARQLLKSLFGINIIALYQVDPIDWFDDESSFRTSISPTQKPKVNSNTQTVHHHLITHPYKIISKYCSFTPAFDYKGSTLLDYEIKRSMMVRRRVEERVKSLFETNYLEQSIKMRSLTDTLKNTITEFTPIVKLCLSQFENGGFCQFQNEVIHFMIYLVLLRVNIHKLENSQNLIKSIDKLLDDCGENKFISRGDNIKNFLRYGFTFLILLTYERGPSQPMLQVAAVIKKLDDIRAKISMNTDSTNSDISNCIIPLLRCLVEDLFIYRTSYFQLETGKTEFDPQTQTLIAPRTKDILQKDIYEQLEPARETVTLRLLDVVEHPEVYDMLVVLILESRWDTRDEIRYKKLSQSLLSLIPSMLSKHSIRFTNYKSIELARQIIDHISQEIFQPVQFICDSLFDVPEQSGKNYPKDSETFHRWMSLILITIDVLTTQVKEEIFLPKLQTVGSFVAYLLQIAQICMAELIMRIHDIKNLNGISDNNESTHDEQKHHCFLLVQQLSSYILYLTHTFQSGLFCHLSQTAVDIIKKETTAFRNTKHRRIPKNFLSLCQWARDPNNSFSIECCEKMFFHIRLIYPDLTIIWCNLMMLLNNVDCNQKFWRELLIYECHHCSKSDVETVQLESLNLEDSTEDAAICMEGGDEISPVSTVIKDETKFRRAKHINRPSSLNLSEINLEDQLRRSFIKKIAEVDTKDKPLYRSIVETSEDSGALHELPTALGNTEQCLSPNVELTRQGVLCLVLDFVTITMNDAEHIVWLIIHQINDIIRWSHEPPISEYITAVHRNSASSGIFIQAINWSFTNLNSISLVRRLLWTLRDVHYTQYGSLVTLLVEKLLSSKELQPYLSITREIEEFACLTVEKLLNETNRGLVTTNEEVYNHLTAQDLIHIYSMLDHDLYPKLSEMLQKLSTVTEDMPEKALVGLQVTNNDSDDDSDSEESDIFHMKAKLIYCLAEKGQTSQFTILISALNSIRDHLADKPSLEKINEDKRTACLIITAVYLLASSTTRLGQPKRLIKPDFWNANRGSTKLDSPSGQPEQTNPNNNLSLRSENSPKQISKPLTLHPLDLNSHTSKLNETKLDRELLLSKELNLTQEQLCTMVQNACVRGLFLVENIDLLQHTQYDALNEVIIRLARLPLINAFVLTPAKLWRQNIWPVWNDDKGVEDGSDEGELHKSDSFKTNFPMVTHEILLKDLNLIDDFCDRLLLLGWINRRQFEEAWMTLLGVLSATMSYSTINGSEPDMFDEPEKKLNLVASCKLISCITQFLLLSNRQEIGNPLSSDIYPCQTFDMRVIDITKSIASNMGSLRKKTQGIIELLELERKSELGKNIVDSQLIKRMSGTKNPSPITCDELVGSNINNTIVFNRYLRVSAEKSRFNATEMQDFVVISKQGDDSRRDEPDIDSCIKLLSSVYKQKFRNPDESLYEPTSPDSSSLDSSSTSLANQSMTSSGNSSFLSNSHQSSPQHRQHNNSSFKISGVNQRSPPPNQIPPPLASAICQSILALSDLFTELDQFDWMFETFIDMFKLAERNEDEIQMSYLIVGLCKSVAICSYALPGEQVTAITHRDVMFEKCRQSIDKCMKSDFGPLRFNALSGAFYMLEDSIHIVASGAYELEHFKKFRQSRLTWIQRLTPLLISNDNLRILTNRPQIIKLVESLCVCVGAQVIYV